MTGLLRIHDTTPYWSAYHSSRKEQTGNRKSGQKGQCSCSLIPSMCTSIWFYKIWSRHIMVIMLDCLSGHEGSIPFETAKLYSVRLSVRTSGFHPGKSGSIPLQSAKFQSWCVCDPGIRLKVFENWHTDRKAYEWFNSTAGLNHWAEWVVCGDNVTTCGYVRIVDGPPIFAGYHMVCLMGVITQRRMDKILVGI